MVFPITYPAHIFLQIITKQHFVLVLYFLSSDNAQSNSLHLSFTRLCVPPDNRTDSPLWILLFSRCPGCHTSFHHNWSVPPQGKRKYGEGFGQRKRETDRLTWGVCKEEWWGREAHWRVKMEGGRAHTEEVKKERKKERLQPTFKPGRPGVQAGSSQSRWFRDSL